MLAWPVPLMLLLASTYRVPKPDDRLSYGSEDAWIFIIAVVGIPLFANIIEFYLYTVAFCIGGVALSVHIRRVRDIPPPKHSMNLFFAGFLLLAFALFVLFVFLLLNN